MTHGEITAGVLNVGCEENRKALESSLGWISSNGNLVTEIVCSLVWSLHRLVETTNAVGADVFGDTLYRMRNRFATRPGSESLEGESIDGQE